MAGLLYGTWGGISDGRLNISSPVVGEGYCGANAHVTSFNAVDNSYPRVGPSKGFTQFAYSFRSDIFCYAMTSNGKKCTLKPFVNKSFYEQSIYLDKDDPPSSFDFVICASLHGAPVIQDVSIVDTAGDDLFVGNDGNYYNTDGNKLDIPSGVTITSEPFSGVYLGSDGKYYNDDGEMFTNLPSGVTPTTYYIDVHEGNIDTGIYGGSDGKLYDNDGNEVLDDVPEGVKPVGNIGEVIIGSDGNYYKIDGSEAFTNLPSGVEIVSYDSSSGDYIGSDGIAYDIDGNPAIHCNGVLVNYSNRVRLTITGLDIFGNSVAISDDITVGQQSINLSNLISPFNLIKRIDGISCRNLDNNVSVGNGQLKIRGLVVGAKISVDLEIIDFDFVPGNFNVCTCVFNVCKKYADIVVNDDMPLGVAQQNMSDIGYYCLSENLSLIWEGFDEIPQSAYPYCCPSLDNSPVISDSIGSEGFQSSIDLECVCDGLESISSKLDNLLCICDKLDTVCDKLDSIRVAIEEKELSVEVEPCSPVVTNPVNNITVTPSTAQITVEPCSPVVTNPVNNITVTPSTAQITVEPCEPVINNVVNTGDVTLDNSDLIDKLDELFTTEVVESGEVVKKDITDIIKDKQCENVVECIVEPVNMAYEGYGKYVDKDMLNENLEHI